VGRGGRAPRPCWCPATWWTRPTARPGGQLAALLAHSVLVPFSQPGTSFAVIVLDAGDGSLSWLLDLPPTDLVGSAGPVVTATPGQLS
jgi:hypothetical protein